MHDAALLRRYADSGSDDAFSAFVRGYLPLVYGAALRRVGGDAHRAQDVTQMVFIAVSRDAVRLARHPDLSGWLFTTTRFLAAKAVRRERRRQVREHESFLQPAAEHAGERTPERLGSMLDEMMMELQQLDRQMLLLRFYRGLRLGEIAARVGASENAVQKRIERAVERLKRKLSRRGITSTAAALAFALEQQGAVTVPTGLAAAATTAGLACGASGPGALAVPGFITVSKFQLCAAAALVVATSAVVWYQRENARLRSDRLALIAAAEAAAREPQPTVSAAPVPALGAGQSGSASAAAPTAGGTAPRAGIQRFAKSGSASGRSSPDVHLAAGDKIPLKIDYPRPLYAGTPRPISLPNLERAGSVPEVLWVPPATVLLSRGRPVTSSDPLPVIGELPLITDGDKTGRDGTVVELGPGRQWIQIDLGGPARVHAVVVWHHHAHARVYHDVVVQVSDDNAFSQAVTTIFNNDRDNSSALGVGEDPAYIETVRGRLIDARGATGRYLRLYSNGNTTDELNHYCEVEAFGEPRK